MFNAGAAGLDTMTLATTGSGRNRGDGDEFAVALSDTPDEVTSRWLQHEFEGRLTKQSCSDDETPDVSASFGFALWPEDGVSPAALLRTADQRMYANKHKHRRRIA